MPRPGAITSTVSAIRPAFKLSHQKIAPPTLTLTRQQPRTVVCVTTTVSTTTSSPPIDTPPRRHAGSAASSMATTQTESIATPASDDVSGKAGVLGLVAKVANWGQSSSSRPNSIKIPTFNVVSSTHSDGSWDEDDSGLAHSKGGPSSVDDAQANVNSKPIWISNAYVHEYACGYGYGYWTGNAAGERAAKESRRPFVVTATGEKKGAMGGFARRTKEVREEKKDWELTRERELAYRSRGRKTAKNM